jgi:transaldolase
MTAAEVGCRYVAPYVNELRVHFEQGYMDPNKDSAINLCGQIQQSFELSKWNRTTPQVVAASLTSINEIMQLAGVKHITISPPLLAELAATPAADWKGARPGGIFPTKLPDEASYEDQMHTLEHRNMGRYLVADEEVWRMKVTRSDEGRSEQKLIQAINIFCDMQDKLEEIVREADVLIQGGKA